MFEDAVYLNCDLPSTIQKLRDPEFFFEQFKENEIIIFDKIHRLENPSNEWIDSFYARDINELFSIRQRSGFLKMLRILFLQSGDLFKILNFAQKTGLNPPTISTYIEAMQFAKAIFLLPPFFGGGKREIVKQPKCYGFDTGFVSFTNGWNVLKDIDKGILRELLVLDTLRTYILNQNIYFWRDKSGREIDFVIKVDNNRVNTIECKLSPESFDTKNLKVF